jgi:hypothetical protein
VQRPSRQIDAAPHSRSHDRLLGQCERIVKRCKQVCGRECPECFTLLQAMRGIDSPSEAAGGCYELLDLLPKDSPRPVALLTQLPSGRTKV